MKYKSVIVTARGGPEVLQIIEHDLRLPGAGEIRIRVLATTVCQDDVACRIGNRPFLPDIPFTPGYAVIGDVEKIGDEVKGFAAGDRVGALTNTGGYAEYIYLKPDQLVKVPNELDSAEAVTLILNYLTAYQCLHRVAGVKQGDRILIIGASGGVGTAFLQLGQVAGLKTYGLASSRKHAVLAGHGATPIDYSSQDFVEFIHDAEPEGLDYVFNGMDEKYFERGLQVLKRGGTLIHYGGPLNRRGFFLLILKLVFYSTLPNGKSIKGYGTHRQDFSTFKQDWEILVSLLSEGRIKPIIAKQFPILAAAEANRFYEEGNFSGNIVLVATRPDADTIY